jgi:L-asparaginase
MPKKVSVLRVDNPTPDAPLREIARGHPRQAHLGADKLLRAKLAELNCDHAFEEVASGGTRGVGSEVWRRLGSRCDHWLSQSGVAGVIVLHEIEGVEETAYFLHRVLSCSGSPVVLTCRHRSTTSHDAPLHLADALVVASTQGARGVVVVWDGAIYAGAEIFEQHPMHEDFGLIGAEPIGFVVGNRVELLRSWPTPPSDALDCFNRCMSAEQWPRVEIVVNHAGNGGEIVHELIRHGAAGIVAVGVGDSATHRGLEESLLYAVEGGVSVVRSPRRVLGRAPPQSDDKPAASREQLPQKARIDLLLALLGRKQHANTSLDGAG